MPLKYWQQSSPYSCGAACLMCALSEINGIEMSAKTELNLWESLHPPYYPGILPASLADYAFLNQIPAQIFYSEERVSSIIGKLSSVYAPVKNQLFLENKNSLLKSEKSGIPLHHIHNDGFLKTIISQSLTSESQKLILTIELSFAHLHYVLIRKEKETTFCVMDPAAGINSSFNEEKLLRELEPHSVGVAIRIG